MNWLIWNARGLGSPRAFFELRQLIAGTSPHLVFICETRLVTNKCKLWRSILGFSGLFVVDAVGQKGGLILMWDNSVDVRVRSYSQGHVDCFVDGDGKKWRFTGFYGNPATDQRKFSWELLKRLHSEGKYHDRLWLVGGDFNEILSDSEKKGGRARPLPQMNSFRETLLVCNLYEVAHPDKNFTWLNKRDKGEVFERLDRFLGNDQWQLSYPNATTKALDFFGSDHRPILCILEGDTTKVTSKGKGRFHFEDKWLLEKSLVPDFLYEWASLEHVGNLPHKLARCEVFFKKWAGDQFDKLGKHIAALRKERCRLMESPDGKTTTANILRISKEIELAVEKESCHWRMRSRLNWLANGDRNTRAFHTQALKCRKKNTIQGMRDKHGIWREDEMEIAQIVQGFYSNLFTSNKPGLEAIEQVVELIQ